MTVYIEYVVIDNLVITALTALISYRILKVKAAKIRTLCASVLGTVCAVFYPFMTLHAAWLLLIKAALYVALSLILFVKKVKLPRGALVFLLVTAAMGGMMFMGGYIVYGDAVKALTLPFIDFPLGAVLLLGGGVFIVMRSLVSLVVRHRGVQDFSFAIEVSVLDKTVKATGFLDSGNLLFDERNGLPVIVLSGKMTVGILSERQIELLVRGAGESIASGARYINFGTLGKDGRILVLKAQKFRLYLKNGANIIREVMLGLSFKGLSKDFDALLSPALF